MTYHGVVLLLSGYQADEEHTIKQYKAIVDRSGISALSHLCHEYNDQIALKYGIQLAPCGY
jgi:hypothetical protein